MDDHALLNAVTVIRMMGRKYFDGAKALFPERPAKLLFGCWMTLLVLIGWAKILTIAQTALCLVYPMIIAIPIHKALDTFDHAGRILVLKLLN